MDRFLDSVFGLVERLVDVPMQALNTLVRMITRLIAILLGIVVVATLAGVVLAVPAAVVYFIYKAKPSGEVTKKQDAGWLDTIFTNDYVVWSARIVLISVALVLLFLGLYISFSIFVRIYRREWLRRAGGFEPAIDERADRDLETAEREYDEILASAWQENEKLERQLLEAAETIEDTQRLADAERAAAESLENQLAEARQELERLGGASEADSR